MGVSYRLTPETGGRLLGEFAEAAGDLQAVGVRFAFGGTPPVAERARAIGFFESCFDGTEPVEEVLAYLDAARAHLATSVYVQTALRPHIVHVVGHTEAHHAATSDDVIEACKLARRAVENALRGAPDLTEDRAVQQRRTELVDEARVTLSAIEALAGQGAADPLTDPNTLARAVTSGLLDAPHLQNNLYAQGQIATRIDERGACVAVDPDSGKVLDERQRIARLGLSLG